MILIDTSAWIDYFRRAETATVARVDRALDAGDVVVGDLNLAELLQGIRRDEEVERISRLLSILESEPLCGREIAELAAANDRFLRRSGITIRGAIDVIVATWCLVNEAEIIHDDRDFRRTETRLGLRAYR